MKERIIEMLQELDSEVDFETCTNLIDDRIIDSLDMVSLIADLEDEFDVDIPAVEIVASNFNSADAIANLVERLREEELD